MMSEEKKRSNTRLSVFLSKLLRHEPELLGLDMDIHGWVPVKQLIQAINDEGSFHITPDLLREIVATDEKGRYRFNDGETKIKACQGHSIPWVIPELTYADPPDRLYHGTTSEAWSLIERSGGIQRMTRHAVHLQADLDKAWASALRWHGKTPVVLIVDAAGMAADGYVFGRSDNGVWCTETVPERYIVQLDWLPPKRLNKADHPST